MRSELIMKLKNCAGKEWLKVILFFYRSDFIIIMHRTLCDFFFFSPSFSGGPWIN